MTAAPAAWMVFMLAVLAVWALYLNATNGAALNESAALVALIGVASIPLFIYLCGGAA
jgi:hypothetical protein